MLKKCNNCNEMVAPEDLWIVKKGITYKEVCTQCKESFKYELEYEVPKEDKNDIADLSSSIKSLTSEIRNLVVLIEKISKR